jgi:hypothetical protein
MSKVNDIHNKHIIKNIVDNAVISHADTVTLSAF